MTLSDIWNAYHDGEYQTSLRLCAQSFTDHSGIDTLHIAGLSLMNLRRHEEGIALLKAACTLRPEAVHIYANAGYLCEQAGMVTEAAYFAKLGLLDFPEDSDLLLLKANSLVMQMRFDDAMPIYREILSRDPTHVQSMINLGSISRSKENFEEAEQLFAQAEAIEPGFRDIRFARATMYTQMGDDKKAASLLEPIANHDIDAQFLLSLIYLSRGDYERGFRLYRARCQSIWYRLGNFAYPINPFDHWSEARDKRIAMIQEGGLGDMIQYVRYVPMLADIAKSVTFYVPPEMERLFHHLPSNVTLQTSHAGYRKEDYDYTTTDGDLAYAFRTTLDTIPNQIPYLFVPEAAIQQRQLPATTWKRVGLCWAGGAQNDLNHRPYDNRRSFDLPMYAPLAAVPGIEFVSLQFGAREEQTCETLSLLRPLEPTFDMLDTAAIIAQLDLVISVDTSIVHLAAAIGKPTWVLSRYDCCWRWLHNRPDSPWYPGVVRVFGQEKYGDWSKPIAEVTQALKELVLE